MPESEPTVKFCTPKEALIYWPNVVDVVQVKGMPKVLLFDGTLVPIGIEEKQPDGSIKVIEAGVKRFWNMPNYDDVLSWKKNEAAIATLYDKVLEALESFVDVDISEYFDLYACWIFHTYLHRLFHYSPQIILYGDQERGKSRLAKTLVWLSYRGIMLGSANEAPVFRLAHCAITVALDVINAEGKANKADSIDTFTSRFEQGLQVLRVRKETGDIDAFEPFGPTVVATNRPLDARWQSRGLAFTPPQSSRLFDTTPTLEGLAHLQAGLIAWRWLQGQAPEIPEVGSYTRARFRDIVKPLLQIAEMFDVRARVDEALSHIARRRSEERAETPEAYVIAAFEDAMDAKGFASTVAVQMCYNDRTGEALRPVAIGMRLSSMKFTKRTVLNARGFSATHQFLNALKVKYGLTPLADSGV